MWADISETRKPEFNTLAISDSLMLAIEWALLRLNHCSLFLVQDDIVDWKLSR